jgi:hypothetical protein
MIDPVDRLGPEGGRDGGQIEHRAQLGEALVIGRQRSLAGRGGKRNSARYLGTRQ